MKIQIEGILVSVMIGWYEYERDTTQPINIDVEVELYSSNWVSQDTLDTTVDYDILTDYIISTIIPTKFKLLESLAQYLSDKILQKFLLIKTIRIDLLKHAITGIKAQQTKISHTLERKFNIALALGSNNTTLPQHKLISTIEILGEYISDINIGKFYLTKPIGYDEIQPDFYNTAITGTTTLKPEELLSKIKLIEQLLGKGEVAINGPRVIDIDLIIFSNLIYTHNFLTIPHKSAHLRDFVLQPLVDIAPDWVHPVFNKSLAQLLAEIPNNARTILRQVNYYKD